MIILKYVYLFWKINYWQAYAFERWVAVTWLIEKNCQIGTWTTVRYVWTHSKVFWSSAFLDARFSGSPTEGSIEREGEEERLTKQIYVS